MSNATAILRSEMAAHQHVMLVGPPGLAKTGVILETANKCGYKTEVETEEGIQSTVVRASLMERVDLTGCLVPDQDKGITRQLPFSLIKGLQKTKEPTLFFVDDLGQGPLDVQASLMRLFDNNFFSENVVVWAATNRPGDKAGVSSLCEPLRSRFNAAYVIPDPKLNLSGEKEKEGTANSGVPLCSWKDWAENWGEWALDNGAPPEVIAWHRSSNYKTLYMWQPNADPSVRMADFRSWGAMIKRWNAGLQSLNQVASVIGKAAAAEFLAFAKLADKLPTVDEIWNDPINTPVPEEKSSQFLLTAMLSQQVSKTTVNEFLQYITRMDRVMTAFAARDAYRRMKETLAHNKHWAQFFNKNQAFFNLGGV